MRTPICDQLGIEFPLFAFSHCRDVVAAVSRAGGYGVLGALAFGPEQLEVELSWIDEHVGGKPYGVDFAMPEKFVDKGESFDLDQLQALIPGEQRDFVEKILADHGVPPMPADSKRLVKAAGLGVDQEGPAQVEVALPHPVSMLVNALGPPPDRGRRDGATVSTRAATAEVAAAQRTRLIQRVARARQAWRRLRAIS